MRAHALTIEVRPPWLRPAAAAWVVALHAAIIGSLFVRPVQVGVAGPPVVELVQEEQQASVADTAQSQQVDPPKVPAPADSPPIKLPEPLPPPEVTPHPEEPRISAPNPVVEIPPEVLPPKPTVTPTPKPEKRKPLTEKSRTGNSDVTAPATVRSGSSASTSSYSQQVHKILQGRANALGLENTKAVIGVSFTIGGSGRITSHSISRPSGDFTVDRAIRSMLSVVSFPPPPGGNFSGTVTIIIR